MTKEQLLDSIDAFLFDLDGTVYLDETPIGDVKGTLARLRALKKRVVFVTNNSSKTEEEYRKKLSRDRKSTRLNSSHSTRSRMPSSA